MPETATPFAAEPYSYAEAHALASELGLSEPVAVTLVRRGYRTPEQARSFLAADESHSPWEFDAMEAVCELVRSTIGAGRRITVHGDFDVDGVCATALTVSVLRELGADCDWFIPNRIEDGYGLSQENVRRLAERGTGLLITVDCGITSVEEVRLARELGMEVVVTDHHQPAAELPNCLILHPQVSFELDRAGGRKFGEGTGRHVGDYMAIVLDGRVQGRPPVIQSRIGRNGQITLTGRGLQEAQDLALTLKAGALPIPLKIVEER
ncbi:MAG TPA: DHH family phosphoesterase, partial [Solirubrobacterales bacterium]